MTDGSSGPGKGSSMRLLVRPLALLSHLLVGAVVVVLVGLGQWQVERLEQVRRSNQLLAERLAADPVDLGALVGLGPLDPAALEFRRVVATGEFRPEQEVLQRNRVNAGRTGFDVLTPLDLGGGTAALVRRGWVPSTLDTPPVTAAPPPAGPTTITGVLERSVPQPRFGARDPEDGVLQRVFHPDTARLDRQVEGDLLPLVLRLDAAPGVAVTDLPVAAGPPSLDEGSHLSYAVQWHLFALIAASSYLLWWRRRLREARAGSA